MKLAVLLDGPSIRGNERQVFSVASGLRERGHEVVVSCRSAGPVGELFRGGGIRTTPVRPRGDVDFWSAARFAAWLRAECPDVLLLASWKRAWIAGLAARWAGVPRVVLRVGDVMAVKTPVDRWKYGTALARYCDAVVANSRVVAEHLARTIPGLRRDRIHEVPNGLRVCAPRARLPRSELGVPAGATVLLAVGGLEKKKGFDLLVAALAQLDSDTHLVIAGEGPERAALTAQAASLGISERIHLLGNRADVPALLATCDVFVLSSRSEGMAVAMLEAVAARRPVVAAEVGGVWELLAPREGRPGGGWMVAPEDAAALAGTLRTVVADLRTGASEVGTRVAEATWRLENWFSPERMLDRYEAVLAP